MALDSVVGGLLIFRPIGTGKSHGGELSLTWNLFPPILIRGRRENISEALIQSFMHEREVFNFTYHKFDID